MPDHLVALYPDTPPQVAVRHHAFITRIEAGDTVRAALRHDACRNGRHEQLAWSTVAGWQMDYPACQARYALARTISADAFADEAIAVARRANIRFGDDERQGVQSARLRFDAARWRASVANPKRYGTHSIDVTSDGERIKGVVALPPEKPPTDVVDLIEGDGFTFDP